MTDPFLPPLRLCVYGSVPTQAWLGALQRQAGADAGLVLLGDAAAARVETVARHPELIAIRPAELAAALTRIYPDADLALVRADAQLPEHAIARLRHALDSDGVLAAGALDNLDPQRSPLPSAASSDAGVERIDALVLAYGEHRVIDSASVSAVLSVWRGGRFAATPQRLVTVDHVYVAAGDGELHAAPAADDPRDLPPPSPLQPLRRRVLEALRHTVTPAAYGVDGKPVLLHVLHGWGGGAERWVNDLASAWDDAHHLVLIARGSAQRRVHGEWLELRAGTGKAPPLRSVALPLPIADSASHNAVWKSVFDDICRDYSVSAVLVSSLIGHSLDALRSGLPTLLLVHDHYPLWPLLHRDFGDPALAFDRAQLQRDLKTPTFEFIRRDPVYWQALRDDFVAAVVAAKATLVAPSRSALANELRLAPEFAALDSRVIAHGLAPWPAGTQTLPTPPARDRLRLVVVGRIRAGKGGQLLAAALDGLREHADLLLLGAGAAAHEFFGAGAVHIVLDYRRADLPRLLADWAPDAALLLPTVAETYSYALSELDSLALPVIATRVGALAERIVDGETGVLVAPEPAAIVAAVAALALDRSLLDRIRNALRARAPISLATMVAAYRPLLALADNTALRYPLRELDLATLDRAALDSALADAQADVVAVRGQLEQARRLAEQRGDWGHALDRDLGRSQSRVQALQGDLAQSNQWAKSLDQELVGVRARVGQLQKDVVERTTWARSLEAQLDERLEWTRTLESQLQERTRWAQSLDAEVAMQREQIIQLNAQWAQELQRQLDDRMQWIQRLEVELGNREQQLASLQHEFDERTEWALALDAEVAAQREQLIGLHAIARHRDEMLASRSWRMLEPFRRLSTRLRRVRLALGYRKQRVLSALSRTRGSLARRGLVATVRRALFELRRRPDPGDAGP